MIDKILKIGDRVEMTRYSPGGADTQGRSRCYNSQLIEIVNDHIVNITVPVESSHLVALEAGGRYELRFITTAGIYVCKAEIRERNRIGKISFFEMYILSELRKDQRRQYFRLDKIKPIQYHVLTEEEERIMEALDKSGPADSPNRRMLQSRLRELKIEELDGVLSNISGGGVKFHSEFTLEPEDRIRMKILLDDLDSEPLDLFGRVVASEGSINRELKNEHRIEFFDISRDTRERIVRYVFNEERKLRQKETGNY